MDPASIAFEAELRRGELVCAYLIEDDLPRNCGRPCRPGSPYCPHHHARCHVGCGTSAEKKLLREVEALARAVGGRRGTVSGGPPRGFLRRLENAVRDFSRSRCS